MTGLTLSEPVQVGDTTTYVVHTELGMTLKTYIVDSDDQYYHPYEGLTWIRGSFDENTEEGKALLLANALRFEVSP